MDKTKLTHQLFIGKVSEIIGHEKTIELLREAKTAIDTIEPHLPLVDISGQVCDHDWIKKYYKDGDYAWKCINCSEIK